MHAHLQLMRRGDAQERKPKMSWDGAAAARMFASSGETDESMDEPPPVHPPAAPTSRCGLPLLQALLFSGAGATAAHAYGAPVVQAHRASRGQRGASEALLLKHSSRTAAADLSFGCVPPPRGMYPPCELSAAPSPLSSLSPRSTL
jgi:hypothetical protein